MQDEFTKLWKKKLDDPGGWTADEIEALRKASIGAPMTAWLNTLQRGVGQSTLRPLEMLLASGFRGAAGSTASGKAMELTGQVTGSPARLAVTDIIDPKYRAIAAALAARHLNNGASR